MGEQPSYVPLTDYSLPGTSPRQEQSSAIRLYLWFVARRGPKAVAGIANQRYSEIEKATIPTEEG